MLFDCVLDCRDNGGPDFLVKTGPHVGLPVTFNYRRGAGPVKYEGRKVYDLGARDIARLMDHLTGCDDDARMGYPDARGRPTQEPEYIPVIGFLECFRAADDFAAKWMDDHSDELLDIVDAKVEWVKRHPPKIGPADGGRMTLKRKGTKPVAETLAEGRPTPSEELNAASPPPPMKLTRKRPGRKPARAARRAAEPAPAPAAAPEA